MRTFLITIISLSFTIVAMGQKPLPDDSGFTNKAEAKNLLVNGLKEGKWIQYKDSNYRNVPDTNAPFYVLLVFKGGIPTGMGRGYIRNGKIHFEAPLQNGLRNGEAKWFYDNSNVKADVFYRNNLKNGIEKEYYENGKLKSETPYINDTISGVVKNYDETGTEIK